MGPRLAHQPDTDRRIVHTYMILPNHIHTSLPPTSSPHSIAQQGALTFT